MCINCSNNPKLEALNAKKKELADQAANPASVAGIGLLYNRAPVGRFAAKALGGAQASILYATADHLRHPGRRREAPSTKD